ncbi:hypothetical protein VOI54_03455 [Tamlana sp. 2201CG12-4]|uniref:hypothetical protein n=1 Tax=Tamlana sp. 2201CG12-4 TaxID=3112582 RepID=UPI002DBDF7F1|nr:hypothetical protein [Tamlana sp. 2201CG12-4]MEC3906058.1 hypothetical protein [Tamlana sp. 2201CG12-4]
MPKKVISLSLSILFLLFVTAPAIIVLVDDSIDVSVFYTASEEEEKGGEKNKEKELVWFELQKTDVAFNTFKANNDLVYFYKKYARPHLNLISPPPEVNIL